MRYLPVWGGCGWFVWPRGVWPQMVKRGQGPVRTMTDTLFRGEALAHQRERLFGDVTLAIPLAVRLLVLWLAVIVAAGGRARRASA